MLPALRCPVCAPARTTALTRAGGAVRCSAGHAFDVARQGYLTLRDGRAGPRTGDTAAMVSARERFLSAGHFASVTDAIAEASTRSPTGIVLDLAGGTGHHLAAVLEARPERIGICLDLSAPALRRAARAHPRAAAIGADVWAPLPVRDAAAGVVLSVFGPRDPDEIGRVLAPGGVLVTASPAPAHLEELHGPLGMIGVDPRKAERQAAAFAGFDRLGTEPVRVRLVLDHDEVAALAGMGPTGAHVAADELRSRVAGLPAEVAVSVAVDVTRWRAAVPSPAAIP